MNITIILFRQIVFMFIYMMIGFFLFKKKLITKEGSKELGVLLLYIILPAAIIKSYFTGFTMELLIGLGISFVVALVALMISISVSRLAFGKKYPIEHFSTAFSNAGFMGIPLIQMTFGDTAVFYVSAFVALLNILQWTYGVVVITGNKEAISIKKIRTNPIIISVLVGIMIFVIPVELPSIITSAVSAVAAMNAPMAMIILGGYLAQIKLKTLFTDKIVYRSALLRLVVIPLLTIALLSLLPKDYEIIKMAILIAAAAPVGSNVAILAQINNLDYTQAVKDVCLSTILCIFTMPLIVGLAYYIW